MHRTQNTHVWQGPPPSLDPQSFEGLVHVHWPRAFQFAVAFIGDRHLAEDMVQEALRRSYEARDQYPLATHFGPYLVKTIARLCIDEKRARRAAPAQREKLKKRKADQKSNDDPAEPLERMEFEGLVAQALARLSTRERACFLMVVFEEMTYRQAAEIMGLSFGEVNNAVHRARLQLREDLVTLMPDLTDEVSTSGKPKK